MVNMALESVGSGSSIIDGPCHLRTASMTQQQELVRFLTADGFASREKNQNLARKSSFTEHPPQFLRRIQQ